MNVISLGSPARNDIYSTVRTVNIAKEPSKIIRNETENRHWVTIEGLWFQLYFTREEQEGQRRAQKHPRSSDRHRTHIEFGLYCNGNMKDTNR